MSYLLRGALLSSAAFFLAYVLLSLGVAGAWRLLGRRAAAWSASLLYGLRALPPAGALLFVAAFVVPAFVGLEPQSTDERFGIPGIALASAGLLIVALGAVSALLASWQTARFVASCPKSGARRRVGDAGAGAVEVVSAKPLFVVAGIHRPKLLISEQAVRLLDENEMRVAVRHELAHARFRDNLKKLGLRAARFPFLSGLERSWMQAAELEADDAAVTDPSGALDLASALLKIAGASSPAPLPHLAMSLVPGTQSALQARVQRLLAWEPRRSSPSSARQRVFFLVFALAALAAGYAPLLRHVHELCELLVR